MKTYLVRAVTDLLGLAEERFRSVDDARAWLVAMLSEPDAARWGGVFEVVIASDPFADDALRLVEDYRVVTTQDGRRAVVKIEVSSGENQSGSAKLADSSLPSEGGLQCTFAFEDIQRRSRPPRD